MVANRSSQAEQSQGADTNHPTPKPKPVAPSVVNFRQNPPLSARVRLSELFRPIPRK